jgi:hypothetical protein
MNAQDVKGANVAPAEAVSALLGRLVGKLWRVTSSGRFISEIDGLRFVAIASVLNSSGIHDTTDVRSSHLTKPR